MTEERVGHLDEAYPTFDVRARARSGGLGVVVRVVGIEKIEGNSLSLYLVGRTGMRRGFGLAREGSIPLH